MTQPYALNTRTVHAGEDRVKPHHAIATPILQTSAFTFETIGDRTQFLDTKLVGDKTDRLEYGCYGNPTLAAVERKLADLSTSGIRR